MQMNVKGDPLPFVGDVIHVFHKAYNQCLAAMVTEVVYGSSIHFHPFYPPSMPAFRDEDKRALHGGVRDGGKWHTVEECRHYRNRYTAQEFPFSHKPEHCPNRYNVATIADQGDHWRHGCQGATRERAVDVVELPDGE